MSTGALTVDLVQTAGGAPVVGTPNGMHMLDLGTVSYGAGSRSSNVDIRRAAKYFVVTTHFGLIVKGDPSHFPSAMVSASLTSPGPYRIRIDGLTLARQPQILAARQPVGSISTHRLEIEVPLSTDEKAGAIPNNIQFEVMPN